MSDFPVVQETKVLIASMKFLFNRNVIPYQFSVARGNCLFVFSLSIAYKICKHLHRF